MGHDRLSGLDEASTRYRELEKLRRMTGHLNTN